MKVTQIYEILNTVVKETIGDSVIVEEDLSNVVQVGSAIFGADRIDNYVKTLVDRIGQTIFVARKYEGNSPSIFMDNWEYGSVTEKVRCNLLTAKENKSWELENGIAYPAHVFYKPTIGVKYYNDMVTFEVPISIAETQVKSSFNSASELNSFISMIYNAVTQTFTVMSQSLAMRAINTLMAIKIDNKTNHSGGVIHLLTDYNSETGENLTATNALTSTKFLQYVAETVMLTANRMKTMSKSFSIGDFSTFTSLENQKLVLLDKLSTSLDVYLNSEVFHNEYVKIGSHDTVSCWQGTGANGAYNFEDISKIKIKHPAITHADGNVVEQSNIVGCLFDKYACGISLYNRRTTSEYTASGEFWTNYNKEDARYFIDINENAVVFLLD